MSKRLMSRRAALGSTAMLFIAGCVGTDAGDDESGPKYDPEAELDLPLEALDTELEERSVIEIEFGHPEFTFEVGEAIGAETDEEPANDLIVVLLDYELYEDAAAASDEFADEWEIPDEKKSELDDLGDEAFWAEKAGEDEVWCFIRDGNLAVQCVTSRLSGIEIAQAKDRAIEYASAAQTYWEEEYANE